MNGAAPVEPTPALERFLASSDRATPYLVLDPHVVADRYTTLAAALPGAEKEEGVSTRSGARAPPLLDRRSADP